MSQSTSATGPSTTSLELHQFPCRSDNYCVLVRDAEAGVTAAIDAPDADAVRSAVDQTGWGLTHILTTHHHADHTAGNSALKEAYGCHIVGPAAEQERIPTLDDTVGEGDTFRFGGHTVEVFDTPGHTAGHISYLFRAARIGFTGDTLFSLGCGRLFEGDAQTMWQSLAKIRAWPRDTTIYCGHEYTLANARFALTVDPSNTALIERAKEIEALREAGKPTLPTTLARELETNPFIRPDAPEIRAELGMQSAEDWEVFAEIRRRKDAA
ncbi:MAG: hydroxyacylglutathione hydrolase [Pseudomonadota bacterium]